MGRWLVSVALLPMLTVPRLAKKGGGPIPDWATYQLELVDVTRHWVAAAAQRQAHIPFGKAATDEANFMVSWFGYYHLTGDPLVPQTAEALFDSFHKWAETEAYRGYYARQEAHHGTEPFIFFPTRLYQLGRRPEAIQAMFRQVADHCGNWSEGVPDWYDWHRHVFRSYYLGTKAVRAEDAPANHPDHFRFLQIALAAYRMTGEQRYLDLAHDYVGEWARHILAKEDGFVVVMPEDLLRGDHAHVERARQVQESGDIPMQVEWHLAGGGLDTFLDLYRLSPRPQYAEVVKRAVPVLLEAACEQWGRPAAAIIGKYRDFTGDRSMDGAIQRKLLSVSENVSESIRGVRLPGPKVHPMGIGQRHDMVIWEYQQADGTWERDGGLPPAALVLLHRLTGDRKHAALAMRKATQRMRWAVENLKDGREHADAGWCIAAVAGGHGRDYAWGELTSALYPAALGSWSFCGEDLLGVAYSHERGPGLPRGVAALFEPRRRPSVVLVNTADAPAELQVTFADCAPQTVRLAAGQQQVVRAPPP